MIIDQNLSEKQIILNHLNAALSQEDDPILETDISLSDPAPIANVSTDTVDVSDPNGEYIYNTYITVSPAEKYNYESPKRVEYRRIDLDTQWRILNGDQSTVIDLGATELTKDKILAALESYFPLRADSVSLSVESGQTSDTRNVRISALNTSLLYVGEKIITVKSSTIDSRINLADLLDDGQLNNTNGAAVDGNKLPGWNYLTP